MLSAMTSQIRRESGCLNSVLVGMDCSASCNSHCSIVKPRAAACAISAASFSGGSWIVTVIQKYPYSLYPRAYTASCHELQVKVFPSYPIAGFHNHCAGANSGLRRATAAAAFLQFRRHNRVVIDEVSGERARCATVEQNEHYGCRTSTSALCAANSKTA